MAASSSSSNSQNGWYDPLLATNEEVFSFKRSSTWPPSSDT